jgi:hypothetical protein
MVNGLQRFDGKQIVLKTYRVDFAKENADFFRFRRKYENIVQNLAVETASHALFMNFIILSVVNRKPKRNAVKKIIIIIIIRRSEQIATHTHTRFSCDKKKIKKNNQRKKRTSCCVSIVIA